DRRLVPLTFEQARQLASTLFVRPFGDPDQVAISGLAHVAAVDRAGLFDLADRGQDLDERLADGVDLPPAARSSRTGDDRPASGEYRDVLDEGGVGVARVGRKVGHAQAGARQLLAIPLVLRLGEGVRRGAVIA